MSDLVLVSQGKRVIKNFDLPATVLYEDLEHALAHSRIDAISCGRVVDQRDSSREYLRVVRDEEFFDILCAPFGSGSYVSWSLYHLPRVADAWTGIPFIDRYLAKRLYPPTQHREDTAALFRDWMKATLENVIEHLTEPRGVRVISKREHKPIMQDFFRVR